VAIAVADFVITNWDTISGWFSDGEECVEQAVPASSVRGGGQIGPDLYRVVDGLPTGTFLLWEPRSPLLVPGPTPGSAILSCWVGRYIDWFPHLCRVPASDGTVLVPAQRPTGPKWACRIQHAGHISYRLDGLVPGSRLALMGTDNRIFWDHVVTADEVAAGAAASSGGGVVKVGVVKVGVVKVGVVAAIGYGIAKWRGWL
jgi:hypothetical protein